MKARELTFIRTQAHVLAWTVAALHELSDLGVVDGADVREVNAVAIKVLNVALQDPLFRGVQDATKRPCEVCNRPKAPVR